MREWMLIFQYAQMKSVLSGMSDRDLSEIGISRTEIPAYARELVFESE